MEPSDNDVPVFKMVSYSNVDIANMLRKAADKIENEEFYKYTLEQTINMDGNVTLTGGDMLTKLFTGVRNFCELGGYDPVEDKYSGNQPDGSFIMPTFG